MRTTIAQLITTAAKVTPVAIAAQMALLGGASAEEPNTERVVWDNGEFDTVQSSGSFSTSKVCSDDFHLTRNSVIGGVTTWVHDVKIVSGASNTPIGPVDSLDGFTGTLSVAFYSDGGNQPGVFIASRIIESPEISATGAVAPMTEHIFRLSGEFDVPLMLPKGDYWIVFHNGAWLSPPEGSNDMVIRGTQGQFGSPAVNSETPTEPGDWEDEFGTTDLAFQLHTTEGFLGHDISVYGRYYDHNNLQGRFGPPYLLGTEQVGAAVEFEPLELPDINAAFAGFDFDTFSIEIDSSTLPGFEAASGNFNGYIFEDANGTLPDFISARVDEAVSTHTPAQILVSPNTIWVNDESHTTEPNALVRIIVTFADERTEPTISLTPSTNGSILLEAPAEVGETYQFEQSTDLSTFTPIDLQFVAASPFVTTHLKPNGKEMFYRLRLVE